MTTEIQQLKEDISILQEKLQKLEEIEKQPRMNLQGEGKYAVVSYHDKVYYRLEGEVTFSWYIKKGVSANYPVPTLVMVEDAETERLLEGLYYNNIQVKKEKEQRVKEVVRESVKWCEENPDKDPLDWLKPQTPEQVADGLKEAFREAQQTENWKELQKKIDAPAEGIYDNIDVNKLLEKWEKDPPEFLKFELGQTLYDLIADWWDEIFMNNNEAAVTIESLVEDIEKWLPKPQSAAGSQSIGVEDMVEGFNDCLKKIKSKMR